MLDTVTCVHATSMFLCVAVIPETPHIMRIEFGNNSIAATLHWKTTGSSEHLSSSVRLRTDKGSWVK